MSELTSSRNPGKPVNPARLHAAYNQLAERVGSAIAGRVVAVLDYSHSAVCRRLHQRVVQETLPEFMRTFADRPADVNAGCLHANGVVVDLSTGAVRVGARRVARETRVFFTIWLAILGQVFLRTIWPAKSTTTRLTILTGVGVDDVLRGGDDREFVRFCRNGPVTPLRTAETLVVQGQANGSSAEPWRVRYHPRPWLAAAGMHRWTVWQSLRFFSDHLRAARAWFRTLRHDGMGALLPRDLAYDALVRSLSGVGILENVVTTCTTYSEQYLWMADLPRRRHAFHTIWYSMSFFPKVYIDDPVEAVLPDFLHMAAEHSWVWTDGQARMLRTWGIAGNLHVVGPLLFCLPSVGRAGRSARRAATVTVFDVTPFRANTLQQHGFVGNYYSPPTVRAFVDGVVRACNRAADAAGIDLKVRFKPKRSYSRQHDQAYVDHVRGLPELEPRVEMLAPDSNLFDVIGESDAVIAIPYSSPAYVAASEGVPAVYFDPTGRLAPRHEPSSYIQFVANEQALCRALTRLLEERVSRLLAN